MDLHPFFEGSLAPGTHRVSPPKLGLLEFTFPISSLVLSSSFKSSSVHPAWISASRRRRSLAQQQQNGRASPGRIAMPGNDTNVSVTPLSPNPAVARILLQAIWPSTAKLILVLFKPGDYEGFLLCLFVCLNA